jgi:hypothetical protein
VVELIEFGQTSISMLPSRCGDWPKPLGICEIDGREQGLSGHAGCLG